MNCFNHRNVVAIGLCKSCGKALCGNCMTELTDGLACKGSCESRVNMINRITDANSKAMNAARHQIKSIGFISIIMGVGSFVFAFLSYRELENSSLPYYMGFLGFIFLVTGILRLSKKQEYPSAEPVKK